MLDSTCIGNSDEISGETVFGNRNRNPKFKKTKIHENSRVKFERVYRILKFRIPENR
jgi:hypothetical protein